MNKTENGLMLCPPWVTYARLAAIMFYEDPDVNVEFDEKNLKLKIYVAGQDKANAISELMPVEKHFGNVTLVVDVVPANAENSTANIVRKAFEGNNAVSSIATVQEDSPYFAGRTYVMFKPGICQFFNDDGSDFYGNTTMLYQDVAKELFDDYYKVSFCTDLLPED